MWNGKDMLYTRSYIDCYLNLNLVFILQNIYIIHGKFVCK
jgi:hypothetical protein